MSDRGLKMREGAWTGHEGSDCGLPMCERPSSWHRGATVDWTLWSDYELNIREIVWTGHEGRDCRLDKWGTMDWI